MIIGDLEWKEDPSCMTKVDKDGARWKTVPGLRCVALPWWTLTVHETLNRRDVWHLTHEPTGLYVIRTFDRDLAASLVHGFQALPFDWEGEDSAEAFIGASNLLQGSQEADYKELIKIRDELTEAVDGKGSAPPRATGSRAAATRRKPREARPR